MKALAAGLPMVVLPHGRDQADNAARVMARGAGVAVKRTAKAAAIIDAVHRVLQDPSYRVGAAGSTGASAGTPTAAPWSASWRTSRWPGPTPRSRLMYLLLRPGGTHHD